MKYFLSLLFLLLLQNICAQSGVKFGLNVANARIESPFSQPPFNDPSYLNPRYLFFIGAFKEFKVSDNVTISPEIQYSKEGAGGVREFSLYYVSLPLSLNFYLSDAICLKTGAFTSYLLHASNEGVFVDDFEDVNNGIFVGMEGIVKKVRLGVMYNLGLSDIETSDSFTIKTQVTRIYISYSLESVFSSIWSSDDPS